MLLTFGSVLGRLLTIFLICIGLMGCRHFWDPKIEQEVFLKKQDLATMKESPAVEPPQPKKALSSRQAIKPKVVHDSRFMTPISLTISETLSMKQVLPAVAKQIGIDLYLDPQANRNLVFSATNRPFIDVIRSICEIAKLRFKITGRSITIESDTPYHANYNVQFLNLMRKTQNRVSIATDVFASVQGHQNYADNGSNSAVNAESSNSFWEELEANLEVILQKQQDDGEESTYTIHKQAGLITIFGTAQQHVMIQDFLEKLRGVASTQVLIEAKVIEVHLKDSFKGGINWTKVGGTLRLDARFADVANAGTFRSPQDAQSETIAIGVAGGKGFSAILHAIENFGSIRTLSNPRLTVLNNQTAILKIAQNQVYFRLNYDKQYYVNTNRESYSLSSDIQTVPIGLVMTVQPSIDAKTGQIILSLRPTISRLSRSVRDPAVDVAILSANTGSNNINASQLPPSLIPVVEVREVDSIIKLNDGEIAILGGLMEARTAHDQDKIPGLGDVPVVGELMKGTAFSDEVIELVILLKATIIEDNVHQTIAPADARLYNDYISDPRPFDVSLKSGVNVSPHRNVLSE